MTQTNDMDFGMEKLKLTKEELIAAQKSILNFL
jgi:hypothetical protein